VYYKGETFPIYETRGNWAKVSQGWVLLAKTHVEFAGSCFETKNRTASTEVAVEWKIQEKIQSNKKRFRGAKNRYIDAGDFLEVASVGTYVYQYENSPDACEKLLKLNFSDLSLALGAKKYLLEDISLVAWGRWTATLAKVKLEGYSHDNFFSLILGDNNSIDLSHSEAQLVETWVSGLRAMLKHSPQMCEDMQHQMRRLSVFQDMKDEFRRISTNGFDLPQFSTNSSLLEYFTQMSPKKNCECCQKFPAETDETYETSSLGEDENLDTDSTFTQLEATLRCHETIGVDAFDGFTFVHE
jgi:hypothetical protein